MIKAVVLIPVRDNDGNAFSRDLWEELDRRLLAFGGLSRAANVHGAWVSDERIYRDVSRQLISALAAWRELAPWLAVIAWAQIGFRQEAMFVEVAGIPEVIDFRSE